MYFVLKQALILDKSIRSKNIINLAKEESALEMSSWVFDLHFSKEKYSDSFWESVTLALLIN